MADGTGFAGYGYTDSGGEKISALIDMINGGGAGRAGQQFEGGGILSLIANLLFSPYGSRARGANSPATAMRPPARPADLAPAPAPASAPPSPARQAAPVPTDARGPRTLAEIMAAAGRTQQPTVPALRGPAGGPAPRTSAPGSRMPTGGPGTFAPGAFPAEVLMASTPPRGEELVPRQSVTFEDFVGSLGSSAEGLPSEVLRDAYRRYLTPPAQSFTFEDWQAMSRGEREAAGLPVSDIGGELFFDRFSVGTGAVPPDARYTAEGRVREEGPLSFTFEDWQAMSRSEREAAGLPVSEIGGQLFFKRFGVGLGTVEPDARFAPN